MSFKERAVEIRRVSKIDDDGEVLPLDFLLVTRHVEDVWETKENLIWQNKNLWIVARRFGKNENARGQSKRFD